MSESRKQFERVEILIRPDQLAAIQSDANTRYPKLHGRLKKRRNFNPALRDIIDFWMAHRPLFLSYLASRGQTPQEPTQ
jgi:hypothetical protein